MPLEPGSRIGPYEVTAQIGAGGMGEVYRARDIRLDRDVALKVLPDTFTADPDRLARFEREARVLASLNHPNIGQLYGLEDAPATPSGQASRALVLELVDGPTLADRIARGPIPIDEALPIARQVAEALEAAHAQGVIHRDLKPANIKIRDDGAVKVLDFGLAKAFTPDAGGADLTVSPTISLTAAATQLGMVIGTAAYMAPEQAKSKPVDTRADVWAFGAVLFEMLSGRRPFSGDDVSDTLAAVLRIEPDLDLVPREVPPRIRGVIRACLQKDPRRRLRDIGDVALVMDGMVEPAPSGPAGRADAPPLRAWQRPLPLAAAGLLLAALAAGAGWMLRPPAAEEAVVRFTIPVDPGAVTPAGGSQQLAISPDGSRVAYRVVKSAATEFELHVRRLDQLVATPVTGADGDAPFFSPDGRWLGFLTGSAFVARKVPVSGGLAVTLGDPAVGSEALGASWGADGQILFGRAGGGLVRVAEDGGEPEPVTALDTALGESGHVWPFIIPGTDTALLVVAKADSPARDGELAVARLDTGEVTRLGLVGTSPRYLPTGHLLFAVGDGTLHAVPFDTGRLEVTGTPVVVAEGVQMKSTGAANFDVSRDGRLAFIPGSGGVGLRRSLVWVDRDGTRESIAVPPRAYTYARLSPDGRRVALDSRDEENDIWIWDLERETLQRLTRDPGMNRGPVWSPDGRRVAFTAVRDGVESPHWQAADGSGTPEPLSPEAGFPFGFTPDGSRLLYAPTLNINSGDVNILDTGGSGQTEPLLDDAFDEDNAVVSPDGRWLAYQSGESGRTEIYVRPFPDVDSALFAVSPGGGSRPRWSATGDELFYYAEPATIMAVPVESGAELVLGRPAVAVQGDFATPINSGTHYDVGPDGRFLLIVDEEPPDGEATPPVISVVLNWFTELEALVPVP